MGSVAKLSPACVTKASTEHLVQPHQTSASFLTRLPSLHITNLAFTLLHLRRDKEYLGLEIFLTLIMWLSTVLPYVYHRRHCSIGGPDR